MTHPPSLPNGFSRDFSEAPEPDFLWQNGEAFTDDTKREWFAARAAGAFDAGAVLCRFSVHPDIAGLILVEAWKRRPADQGDIRWQLTTTPGDAILKELAEGK